MRSSVMSESVSVGGRKHPPHAEAGRSPITARSEASAPNPTTSAARFIVSLRGLRVQGSPRGRSARRGPGSTAKDFRELPEGCASGFLHRHPVLAHGGTRALPRVTTAAGTRATLTEAHARTISRECIAARAVRRTATGEHAGRFAWRYIVKKNRSWTSLLVVA